MNSPIPRYFFSVLLLLIACTAPCFARPVPSWSYEKLVAESDVVAIVEPVANIPAQDAFSGNIYGHPTDDFAATDTHFKIHSVFKGNATSELTVLHFNYSTNVMSLNGATFVQFYTEPLQYEMRAVKDGKAVGGITVFRQQPVWIAFLKRRSDGRFEPVTGQYDSTYSFRELHRSSFYAKP